jgi:ribosomal-protein-alanine N-acetyltransferase
VSGVFVAGATARDVEDLARLHRACHSHPWTPAQIAAEVAQPPPAGVLLVRAVRGGGACAACAYRVVGDEMEVLDVSVAPRWRRRGLARLLVSLALARGGRAGARRAFLEVRASNAAAMALYEALGFREAGRRKGYYGAPLEDAVLLETAIPHC